jgi:protein phosphatase
LEEVDYSKYFSESSHKMVFLGDYVDRGPNSICVLYAVCRLKQSYPESVVLLRGNHEAPAEFQFSSHDFPFELAERFGQSEGKMAYRKALALFKELGVAAIVSNRILFVHGGLPTRGEASLDFREILSTANKAHLTSRLLEELLWNDPRDVTSSSGWEDSRRGIGRHFGEVVTQKWLEGLGAKCLVRGHEPCQGFKLDHGSRIMTLFSCSEPYPKFKAAYLSIGRKELNNVRDASDLVPFVKFPVLT